MNHYRNQLIQTGNPYTVDNGQPYKGASGQDLFDIQYVEFNNIGETGPWYKVTLYNRVNNINKVGTFLKDYYKTIKVVDFTNIMAYIMESLSGCLSISGNVGITQTDDVSKFSAIIQRVLGLCFDNTKEIDVSGIAKIAELDGVDDGFFELTEVDLRNIDLRISNIQNGVMEFQDCENVKLPVDFETIVDELINFRENDNLTTEQQVQSIVDITNSLFENPDWKVFLPTNVDLQAAVNKDIIKQIKY